VAEVADDGVTFQIGLNVERPVYELRLPEEFGAGELSGLVHVTADLARKNWADLRATARLLNVQFVISTSSDRHAVFRRYPGHEPIWPQKWVSKYNAKNSNTTSRTTLDRIESLERTIVQIMREISCIKDHLSLD
jgi:hypothetical protein